MCMDKYTNEIMKRVDLYLKEEQIQALNEIKTEHGVPVSESVRRAIDDYLNKSTVSSGDLNGSNNKEGS